MDYEEVRRCVEQAIDAIETLTECLCEVLTADIVAIADCLHEILSLADYLREILTADTETRDKGDTNGLLRGSTAIHRADAPP